MTITISTNAMQETWKKEACELCKKIQEPSKKQLADNAMLSKIMADTERGAKTLMAKWEANTFAEKLAGKFRHELDSVRNVQSEDLLPIDRFCKQSSIQSSK